MAWLGAAWRGSAGQGAGWPLMLKGRVMAGKLFFGGLPTASDVAKLMALDVTAGQSVSYADVSDLIGVDPKSNRFGTVADAWIRAMFRERNIEVVRRGGAFVALEPRERISESSKRMTRIGRAAGRAAVKVVAIDARELSEDEQRRLDLMRREIAALRDEAARACRSVALPAPVTSIHERRTA